jgi:hypothetical protein
MKVVGVHENKLLPCFAACKMVLIDEMKEKHKYEQIEFVEFLEFICRVADYKYRDKEKWTLY